MVHEHQTVQGVLEDVHQVVQRLKALTLVLAEDVDDAVLHIRREGAGPVYARDIQEHGSVTVKNPDHLLFTLQDDREVSMELYVNKGRGYVEAEMHPADRSLPIDLVRIDAIYNPVRRANFTVAETRVGQRTDYDRLTVSVETNGTITPEDAIAYAAALAQVHFQYFVDFGKVPTMRDGGAPAAAPGGANLRLAAQPADRRLRALGPVAQFAQELEHPDPQGSGGVLRGRPAQGQERGREGAERDRRAAAARRAQLRDGLRGGRRRASRAASRRAADGAAVGRGRGGL